MKIGVIGLGLRMGTIVTSLLDFSKEEGGQLAAVTELKSKEQLQKELPHLSGALDGAAFYASPEEMLDRETLDGVLIGTRCSLHARLAKLVLERGLPLFLEKPVCTTISDYELLRDAGKGRGGRVVVSFPLRFSPIVQKVREIVRSGEIGEIQHIQAVNYVPYGGVYYHSWYRDESETGGLFLQKATHDFDYVNAILGDAVRPVQVAAMGSKQIFKGGKPAGLTCPACPEYKTCPESSYTIEHVYKEYVQGTSCCFGVDTGNHDSASALVRFETGMHMNYTQNFFIRKHAAKRGAIFSGYEGTVEFDWYTNEIRVSPHHSSRADVYRYDDTAAAHFGGDERLVRNFMQVMGGGTSDSPLRCGLRSALMCLRARESEQTGRFAEISE